MSNVIELSIGLIKVDEGTQMRECIDQNVRDDYRDQFLANVEFRPVDVFHDGTTYWLADGFHRYFGAQDAGRVNIKCTVHDGGLRDAILFAAGANADHGLKQCGQAEGGLRAVE